MRNGHRSYPKHPQVRIGANVPKYAGIEVDEKMQPLLALFWELGADTNFSCQGDPQFVDQYEWDAKHARAYIQFVYSDITQAILIDILTHFYPFREDTEREKRSISFDLEYDRSPHDNQKRICVRFPHAETEHLTAYLTIQVEREKFKKQVTAAFDKAPEIVIGEYLAESHESQVIQDAIAKLLKDEKYATTATILEKVSSDVRMVNNAISIMRRQGRIFNSTPNRRTGTWHLRTH